MAEKRAKAPRKAATPTEVAAPKQQTATVPLPQDNIDALQEVPLTMTIVLGRSRDTLERVLEYGDQSLVELDKSVGDPVDVLLNGELFARGEVVTVSENFGVRVTELVAQPGA